MKCSKCGAELADGVMFCRECGSKVLPQKKYCRECGAILGDNAKFCSECGAKISFREDAQKSKTFDEENTIKDQEAQQVNETTHVETNDSNTAQTTLSLSGYGKTFHQNENNDESVIDKIKVKVLLLWNSLDLFCQIATIGLGIVVFLLLISIAFHKGLSIFISLVQLGGIITAVLIHQGIIKAPKYWLKYLILSLAIFFTIFNVMCFFPDFKTERVRVDSPSISENQQTDEEEGIYVYKIRNYIGKNLASIGKQYAGYRVDEYGEADLRLIYVSSNGMYINASDEDQLKQYVVVGQSIPEETNIAIVNLRDSKGKPYSNLVDYQSYEEIVLYVDLVGNHGNTPDSNVEIKPSTNRRLCYVRNYVGRNAASFGKSYGSNRIDEYFSGDLKLEFSSKDGSFVDANDLNILKQYIVVEQDVKPNAEIHLVYETDSKGNEYHNLIKSQNIETVSLIVEKLDDSIIAMMPDIELDNHNQNNYTELTVEYKILNNSQVEITGFSGDGNRLTIDSNIDGHKVTSIGDRAFENCNSLEKIICLASIEQIGDYAFANNTSLKEISIPNETRKIGAHAFEGCSALEKAILWGDPDIGEYAFANCTALKEISIGYDTKQVGAYAFDGCTSLEKAVIWNDNTIIGKGAFSNCPKLKASSIEVNDESSLTSESEKSEAPEATIEKTEQGTAEEPNTIKESETIKPFETVSYSTNTKDTVKNGNAGVYAYKKGNSYDIYYIIDFDEGYVYRFTDGNGDSYCDRLKIESGDLNSTLIVTYHDGNDEWSNGLHFKYKNQPNHLIMEDNNHFEYDFITTDLSNALSIKKTKIIRNY